MNEKLLVGIDLGSSNISAVAAYRQNTQGLKYLGETSVEAKGIENGLVKNHNEVRDSLKSLIIELQKIIGRDITDVYLTVPSGLCNVVSVNGEIEVTNEEGIIGRRDIRRVKEAACRIVVPSNHVIIQLVEIKYNIDDKMDTKNPIGMKGRKLQLEGYVILMKTKDYEEYAQCFHEMDILVSGLRIASEAAAQLLIDDLDRNRGVFLIDCGRDKIDIAIYYQDRLQGVMKLPFGGENITKDLSYCFKITKEQAEELKLFISKDTGSYKNTSIDLDLVREVIDARLSEIGEIIDSELKKNEYSSDISNVVIYGQGVSLFNNIENRFYLNNEKKVSFVSHEVYEQIKSKYINARGLVNLVDNELKWEYEKDNVNPNVIEENVIKNITEKSKINKKHGIVSKMKSILEDLF